MTTLSQFNAYILLYSKVSQPTATVYNFFLYFAMVGNIMCWSWSA